MMKKMFSLILFVALLSSVFPKTPVLFAVETGQDQKIQPLPKGVSIHRLGNGMKVLLIENPALPMIGVNVVVKVGSAYETFATSGMSHCLEHLLFNGTTKRTQKQLYDDVDRIGGYNNANTSEFYTNYMMVTPAEHIYKGMEIQADMLFNSTIPPEKFVKEKGIVLEEISKSLVNSGEQMERNIISILYSGHALSLPTLGTYSTVESLSRDQVYAFYKNNYVPNNMVMSVIGNFQTKEMLKKIKEIYGAASPGNIVRKTDPEWSTGFQTRPASQFRHEKVYHRFYDGKNRICQLFFQLPQTQSSEFFDLLNIILEKRQAQIQKDLESEFPKLIKSVKLSARPSPLTSYVVATVTINGDLDYDAMVKSLSAKIAAVDYVLPEETVDVQVTKTRTAFLKNIEKPHMFGIYNADEFATKGIEAVLASYSGQRFYKSAEQLKTVKLNSEPIVIIQNPNALLNREKIKSTESTKLFTDQSTGKTVIAVQNSAGNLLAVHYLVKHKAYYESKYGKDAAKILHDCLGQRLDSDKNQKISSRFGFTYVVNDNPYFPMDDIYLHPDFGYIRVEGLADDLPGAIGYLNSQIKNFKPTQTEFKKAIGKSKHTASMAMMGGGDKARKLFDKTYKPLVFEPALYPEGEKKLTYENLLAFAKAYFRPANMIVSVVSPASPDSINKLFAGFNGEPVGREPQIYNKTLRLNDKDVKIDKDGGGNRSYLYWGFTRKIDPEDKPALKALSLILSDIIVFDIREKQGMAYRMSAGIDLVQNRAAFYIRQGTRPQNVAKLLPRYPGFFKMKILDSVTADDLAKSVNMYLGRMMFRRLSSINRAYYLAHSLYFYGDITYDKQFLDRLKTVTLQDVKRAAKKYMKIKNTVSVVVR
ncbi:MAG TPA: insulinase family protein [Bacteroidetes bacterium]|nr:insulinase family protein [Bacteroidota bacterium]